MNIIEELFFTIFRKLTLWVLTRKIARWDAMQHTFLARKFKYLVTIRNSLPVLFLHSYFFQKKAGQRSEDMDIIEESASEAFEMHSSLLSKGFALEGPPNVQQALDGVIPFRFGFCV